MTLWTARTKAEAEYKAAVRMWKADPCERNAQRVRVRLALLDGLQKWMAERNWGGVR